MLRTEEQHNIIYLPRYLGRLHKAEAKYRNSSGNNKEQPLTPFSAYHIFLSSFLSPFYPFEDVFQKTDMIHTR
jgi:hypothetical protein